MFTFIFNAIKIIFVIGFLVFIHEGGHFLVAKFFKVKVNEFSIGFGKKIWSKQKGETLYSIRIVPLGGFVSMLGEEERSDDERSFSKQSITKRIAIVAAGGLVNIVFGLLIYFIVIACIGNFASKTVDSLVDNYGAMEAGVLPGDEIISINGKHIFITADINKKIQKTKNKPVEVIVKRKGQNLKYIVKPTEVKSRSLGIYLGQENKDETKISYIIDEVNTENGLKVGDIILTINEQNVENNYKKLVEVLNTTEGEVTLTVKRNGEDIQLKVTPIDSSNYYLGVVFKTASKSFFARVYYAWFETGNFAITLVDNVKNLLTGGVPVNQMMGPIGISKTVASTNTLYEFVYLMALISLSLGITNLLPFPALDGGKILILIIEAIRRKPLKEQFEIWIQLVGFALLILLSLYVSYQDILRFF